MTNDTRLANPAPFPTRPVRRGPPGLGVRVRPHLARLAKASGALDPQLALRWDEVAGPALASLCRPLRLKRNRSAVTLEVAVPSGAAAMRVQYAQGQLLERARTALREPRLTKLAIVQAGAGPEPKARWRSRAVEQAGEEAPPPRRPARDLAEALARLRDDVAGGR